MASPHQALSQEDAGKTRWEPKPMVAIDLGRIRTSHNWSYHFKILNAIRGSDDSGDKS
jgi:hypothetical protein